MVAAAAAGGGWRCHDDDDDDDDNDAETSDDDSWDVTSCWRHSELTPTATPRSASLFEHADRCAQTYSRDSSTHHTGRLSLLFLAGWQVITTPRFHSFFQHHWPRPQTYSTPANLPCAHLKRQLNYQLQWFFHCVSIRYVIWVICMNTVTRKQINITSSNPPRMLLYF